ncbi:MAG: hypothetical protein PHO92_04735, partial [Candidatus Peribacteraceae bacterium]|nr:hypothetical protein [Candidatus Peribacteraceae bacterium]
LSLKLMPFPDFISPAEQPPTKIISQSFHTIPAEMKRNSTNFPLHPPIPSPPHIFLDPTEKQVEWVFFSPRIPRSSFVGM